MSSRCFFSDAGDKNFAWTSNTNIIVTIDIPVREDRACQNGLLQYGQTNTLEVNGDQQRFGYPHSSKYVLLCSAVEGEYHPQYSICTLSDM